MPRFPIKKEQINNRIVRISGSDYKHIVKVLRLSPGDQITLFEQDGLEHSAVITEIGKYDIILELKESKKVETESKLNITLLQGIPKGDKMDLIVEKATELGVKSIIPVITSRSQFKYAEKVQRWQRIALESSKQCGRTIPTQVYNTLGLNEAFNNNYVSSLALILYEKHNQKFSNTLNNIIQLPSNITLCVGPEGGFSEEEVNLAIDRGFAPIGLGPRILRTETAGLVAISILQFLYGDI